MFVQLHCPDINFSNILATVERTEIGLYLLRLSYFHFYIMEELLQFLNHWKIPVLIDRLVKNMT